MKFSEYDEKENKKIDKIGAVWVSDFDFEVSHLISEARLTKGLTQEQLAKLVGTQQPSIARVENGSFMPSLGFLKRIALAIGTSLIPPRFAFMETPNSSSVSVTYYTAEKVKYLPIFVQSAETSTNELCSINK